MKTKQSRLADNVKDRLAPTAVYRLFDSNDQLLYVGISCELVRRLRAHAKRKPWWPLVARQDVQWFPNRAAAEREELRVITEELPQYNVRYHPQMPHGGHGSCGSRLDVGLPPIRHVAAEDEIWEPALENAKAEGKSLAKVINEFLVRYNAKAERKRRQGTQDEESTS